jgi:hypothetical protein
MFPSTAERVANNTSERANARIRCRTEANVARLASAEPGKIEDRLAKLNGEWDVERVVETLAPTVTLLWLALALKVDRKLLVIPAMIQGFVLLHAVQGWFPPLPVLRRLGVRTTAEIDQERNALKALRGDFRNVTNPSQALEAVRR